MPKQTAAQMRKRQAACSHPSAHVHPAIDARFETCDLCHIIAPAPINPPWFIAYDEEQPAPAPLQLFGNYTSEASGEAGEEEMPTRPKTRARSR